jgi:hypothetical protein
MERWCEAGGSVYMVSLTLPHRADQSLAEVLGFLDDARQRWKNAKKVKAILSACDKSRGDAGSMGSITALECTVGWNGWHPHLHMLIFANRTAFGEGPPNADGDLSSPAIDVLRLEWVRILLKIGAITQAQASDAYRHGLNVRGGDKAADYVAKYGDDEWDLSRELASLHAKIGVRGTQAGFQHFAPFQLLAIADAEGEHAVQARAMFREFSDAFTGKRLLTWSPGLRARLGIAELSDEDIAAELDKPIPGVELEVAQLTHGQFSTLTATRSIGAFLEYVATECVDLHIAQDLVDRFVDRQVEEGRRRAAGEILRDAGLHMHAPMRYRYEETIGDDPPADQAAPLDYWRA